MPLVSCKVVKEEPQIQSGLYRSTIPKNHSCIKASLLCTIWKMDQSVVSSEKSFRLFLLELSYLLKEFVDLKINESTPPSLKRKIFTPSSELASETLRKIQVALKSRLFSKCARTVFLNQGWHEIKVKFMSCREIKVVFKIRQNCSLKVKINLDFWGKIHELPWNQGCFQNAPELFFEG